jgi:hypothetical protein
LKAGDAVIVDNMIRLRPGATVQVRAADASAQATAGAPAAANATAAPANTAAPR